MLKSTRGISPSGGGGLGRGSLGGNLGSLGLGSPGGSLDGAVEGSLGGAEGSRGLGAWEDHGDLRLAFWDVTDIVSRAPE